MSRHGLADEERFDVLEAHLVQVLDHGDRGAQAQVRRVDVALRHQDRAFDGMSSSRTFGPAVIDEGSQRRGSKPVMPLR